MAWFNRITKTAAAVGTGIIKVVKYVVDKVSAAAPQWVKLGMVAAGCAVDTLAGAPVGTSAAVVQVCVAVVKELTAPSRAAEARAPNCSPETQPEPDALDHACERTWVDRADELGVGVASTLVTMALIQSVKSIGALAKRARSSLLQPVWTVTRDTSLTPWIPVSVRAAR